MDEEPQKMEIINRTCITTHHLLLCFFFFFEGNNSRIQGCGGDATKRFHFRQIVLHGPEKGKKIAMKLVYNHQTELTP
jgi:hypothetical protein